MIAAGYNEEQIFRYFEASYGEFIRLLPQPKGFNLFVWIAPGVALVVGLLVLIGFVRKNRREGDRQTETAGETAVAEAKEAASATADTVAKEPADELAPWLAQVRKEVSQRDG